MMEDDRVRIATDEDMAWHDGKRKRRTARTKELLGWVGWKHCGVW